jgi:hypothetical protein
MTERIFQALPTQTDTTVALIYKILWDKPKVTSTTNLGISLGLAFVTRLFDIPYNIFA